MAAAGCLPEESDRNAHELAPGLTRPLQALERLLDRRGEGLLGQLRILLRGLRYGRVSTRIAGARGRPGVGIAEPLELRD